jgi:hypothetical protein
VWYSGNIASNITAATQAVVALLAIVAGVLGSTGLLFIGADLFRGSALFVAGILLVAMLIEGGERREEWAWRLSSTSEVQQIAPHQIKEGLEDLLRKSSGWSYRGGSGRWLRQATLPVMATKRQEGEIQISIQLLDPRDEGLCVEYARFRAFHSDPTDSRPNEDDPRTIQSDILASIYAAGWYSWNSRVRPSVVLLRGFSPLRFDAGSAGLFVTIANRSQPALYASNGSWYYKSVTDELSQARYGFPTVIIPHQGSLFPPRPAAADVRRALAAMHTVYQEDVPVALLSGFAAAEQLDFAVIAKEAFRDGAT